MKFGKGLLSTFALAAGLALGSAAYAADITTYPTVPGEGANEGETFLVEMGVTQPRMVMTQQGMMMVPGDPAPLVRHFDACLQAPEEAEFDRYSMRLGTTIMVSLEDTVGKGQDPAKFFETHGAAITAELDAIFEGLVAESEVLDTEEKTAAFLAELQTRVTAYEQEFEAEHGISVQFAPVQPTGMMPEGPACAAEDARTTPQPSQP